MKSEYQNLSDNLAAPLDKIPYIDYPELRINKNESTEMPFRYVAGKDGECIMPDVKFQRDVEQETLELIGSREWLT